MRVEGLGFRVQGSGFRVEGLGLRVYSLAHAPGLPVRLPRRLLFPGPRYVGFFREGGSWRVGN